MSNTIQLYQDKENKFRVLESSEELNEVSRQLDAICYVLGIKKMMTPEQKKVVIMFLKDEFPDFSIQEVQEACKKAMARKLDVDPKHYQQFDIDYVGRILTGYREYRRGAVIEEHKTSKKSETDTEKDSRKARAFISCIYGTKDNRTEYPNKRIDLKYLYNKSLKDKENNFHIQSLNASFHYWICDHKGLTNFQLSYEVTKEYWNRSEKHTRMFRSNFDRKDARQEKAFQSFIGGDRKNRYYEEKIKHYKHLCFFHWISDNLEMEVQFDDLF